MSVGTSWTYATYDSIAHSADTLVVTILNTVSVSNAQFLQRWQFKSSIKSDTVFVIVNGDTVSFLDGMSYAVLNMTSRLVFPLAVGQGWSLPYISDSAYVAETNSFSVPAGSYSNAFRIEEGWYEFNVFGHTTTWFKPQVGILWMHHIEVDFSSANTIWKLKTSHIVQ